MPREEHNRLHYVLVSARYGGVHVTLARFRNRRTSASKGGLKARNEPVSRCKK